jgi:hypothetical protein
MEKYLVYAKVLKKSRKSYQLRMKELEKKISGGKKHE